MHRPLDKDQLSLSLFLYIHIDIHMRVRMYVSVKYRQYTCHSKMCMQHARIRVDRGAEQNRSENRKVFAFASCFRETEGTESGTVTVGGHYDSRPFEAPGIG